MTTHTQYNIQEIKTIVSFDVVLNIWFIVFLKQNHYNIGLNVVNLTNNKIQ
jgi:hypothetical protein